MGKLFISHSSQDDAFVRALQQALANHGEDGWIDSRELPGGDPLWSEIERAIDAASAYAVVVSPDSLQSKWVGKELRHALAVQKQRGRGKFAIIPLSLNGTKLGVLEEFFGEEPVYIPVTSAAGGVEAALNAILVAMGKRLPADVAVTLQPKAEPLEELVLELTDLKFHEQDGVRRASARARLVYEPATAGRPPVHSKQQWRLIAPIGPIEAEELRWYLEKYAVWPSDYFRDRARKVEANLVTWGRFLHDAAMPPTHTANVMRAWEKIGDHAGRRFSVHVDTAHEAGAPEIEVDAAREAATVLLGLPWELLHDGDGYLFQGAKPTRVRRRLPNTRALDVPVVATPIRILLVTARPEDEACGYIDHRASALPLVEAMESLPGLVQIHVLSPPTLGALREELDRARIARQPYHVVHFDGHGVYDRNVGLGGLCFEHPEDSGKLEKRRHVTVYTHETAEHGTGVGTLLRDHRIPLVFLEACQTAQAEKASESVASELLRGGVASVVAMSHSVLVETARRFVEAFYDALAAGWRVGDAMLDGQRRLKDDSSRGRIFGVGELRLDDWFVPVLFQEKEDPQLFKVTPSRQTQEDFLASLASRLGDLPPPPETGFIGRSRELLALERLLRRERYAVVRGQGGEGKTALAAECARWMVRSHQVQRTAFVSLETHSNQRAVLDVLGRQLVGGDFSAAGDLEEATLKVERALREQATLIVLDNLESVLLPEFVAQETPEALSEQAQEELTAILALCTRLLRANETRLIFTSREWLPAPFDAAQHRRELRQLDREDAVKLVERVVNVEAAGSPALDAAREEIEQLVDAVHCHARTLALLAPALREQGVEATRASLVELMAAMEQKFPGNREQSVFASVELSLRRMSQANRDRARVLGVFHGSVDLDMLARMMEWETTDAVSLAVELVATGLATQNPFNHLTLNPALCPYLRELLNAEERQALAKRWVQVMFAYVTFLAEQRQHMAEAAIALTRFELANFFGLLEIVRRADEKEATIAVAAALHALLEPLGKLRLRQHVGHVRDAVAVMLGDSWNHTLFLALDSRIEQQLATGQLRDALGGARLLLERAQAAGAQAYPSADFDLATAHFILARALTMNGVSEPALPLLIEARRLFEAIGRTGVPARASEGAEEMVQLCLSEQADCLTDLGRLDDAAALYESNIRHAEQRGATRSVAVGKTQLGTVRMLQRRYSDALAVYAEARERFLQLDEPGAVAGIWHQTGMTYERARQPEAAEDAYQKSLAIKVRLGDVAAQASTIAQLGSLYAGLLGRLEEAATLQRQAADKYAELGDVRSEYGVRTNLAVVLQKLGRLDEARLEARLAIDGKTPFGHAFDVWTSWDVLAQIETRAGDAATAAEAKRNAIRSYAAYRRDGGENQNSTGRLALLVTKAMLGDGTADAAAILQGLSRESAVTRLSPFIRALQAVVAGSRDRALADDPDLSYRMAAEVLVLIEALEDAQRSA